MAMLNNERVIFCFLCEFNIAVEKNIDIIDNNRVSLLPLLPLMNHGTKYVIFSGATPQQQPASPLSGHRSPGRFGTRAARSVID